ILFPMISEILTPDEFKRIAEDSDKYGYCFIDDVPVWQPTKQSETMALKPETGSGLILPSGVLSLAEIVSMLDTLPFDITFVDKNDTVKYFSQAKDRIFPRTKAVIGRKVTNCHPPASVHIVEKIISDLKSGAKDHEDFWIHLGNRYVLIRYYAVRNEAGEYLGTLEVTQDIAPIQAITGEKRLLSK
ncbi:MAG TPA: PAS domain-containing protein, partial [Clostridia bacterium]|nr:PAS domain-containing protein [Clostridia bacterium]